MTRERWKRFQQNTMGMISSVVALIRAQLRTSRKQLRKSKKELRRWLQGRDRPPRKSKEQPRKWLQRPDRPPPAYIQRYLNQEMKKRERRIYARIAGYVDLKLLLGNAGDIPPLLGYAVAPDFALLLAKQMETIKPKSVLELGSGFSTIVLAYCASKNGGSVTSLDHEQKYAQNSRVLLDVGAFRSLPK